MRTMITLTLAAALCCLGSVAGAQQEMSDAELRLVELVNGARLEAGVAPLQPHGALAAVARGHSDDMATNRFFSHVSPTTGDMSDRLAAAEIPYQRAGENIAFDVDVDTAHQAFMNSEHHRENVLNPDYTHIGVGAVASGDRLLVTQAFMSADQAAPVAPAEPEASPEPPAANDQAPTPADQAPAAPAPATRRSLSSPFELLDMLSQHASSPPAAPAPEQPEAGSPAPGVYIVTDDGAWHQVELGPDVLLRLLSAM